MRMLFFPGSVAVTAINLHFQNIAVAGHALRPASDINASDNIQVLFSSIS
jgi:hypothetical protein